MIIIIEILKTKSTACCVKQKEEEEKVCSIFANFLLLSRKPSLYLSSKNSFLFLVFFLVIISLY